jgi:hypothetical protein
MTDKFGLKQVQEALANNDARQGWLAIGVALGLSLFMAFGISGVYLREPEGASLFYPLLLITQYGPFQALLWIGVTVLFLGLLIFAAAREKIVAALLTFLVGGFFLLFGFGFATSQMRIQPYQTLSYQNHVYYLVSMWEAAYDMGSETERYQVLECDSMGLMCYRFQTPYGVELSSYNGKSLDEFDPSGELFVDETLQVLKLRVGAEVYSIVATNRP